MEIMLKYVLFSFLVFTTSAYSKIDTLFITPVAKIFDSLPPLQSSATVYISTIQDSSSTDQNSIIGTTRNGIKTTAPVVIKNGIPGVMSESIKAALNRTRQLATDPSTANFLLRVTVLECKLIEKSATFSQTIEIFFKCRVILTDPLNTENRHEFTIKNQNIIKAMDTSKYAESAVSDCFKSAIIELLKNIPVLQ
jgi:hypothetical protein